MVLAATAEEGSVEAEAAAGWVEGEGEHEDEEGAGVAADAGSRSPEGENEGGAEEGVEAGEEAEGKGGGDKEGCSVDQGGVPVLGGHAGALCPAGGGARCEVTVWSHHKAVAARRMRRKPV